MKKIIIGILLAISICFVSSSKVYAQDNNESKYIVNRSELDVEYIMGGTVYKQSAYTYYDGYLDPTSKYYRYIPQTYQWVEIPASSQDIKTVVWSCGSVDGFKASTTTATAKDWEAKHPGWIVVAAGNGDWFRINDTCEATNIMVQDGEVLRPFTYTNVDWRQVLGWSNGGNLIVGVPTIDNFMTLHIYKDKTTYTNDFTDELTSISLAGYNTTPSETGVYLYTKDATGSYDFTGYNVYVGKYDLCRAEYDSRKPFVKGTIKKITNELGKEQKPVVTRDDEMVREFYLVTKDNTLDDKLSVDNYVKCQFDLNGEWKNVTDACGYVNQCLSNYQPLWGESCDDYGQYDEKTAIKPRMIIGFKEDGTIVMMDIDGRDEVNGHTGLSCFEAGELMRLAGCKDAYNLDGGGSATLIVRNEYDDFDIVNIPSDGSERSIGNAILFVMRDPGISWDIQNTTRSEVIFTKENSEYANEIKNVKVEIDGKVAEMKDGKAIVSGLKENSTYIATVSYEAPSTNNDGTMVNGSYKVEVRTKAFEIPNSGISFTDINKTSVKAIKNETDYEIKNVKISMNGTEYQMGSVSEYVLTDLIGETEYNIVIEYTVVDYETGNEYQGVETYKLTTLAFELPVISEFRVYKEYTDKIKLKYAYVDKDSVVKKVEIQYNESSLEVTGKQGYPELTNLDLENEKYEITLVLTYVNGKFAEVVESEKIVIGKGAEEIITHNINYVLDGGALPENTDRTYQEKVGLSVLPTPTKDGFEFTGWYNEKGEKVTSISVDETTDITLTAHWERESKKGCNCGCNKDTSIRYILSLTTLLASLLVILRKKK